MAVELKVLAPGDISKPTPYTIAIVSNPAIEAPWKSNQFVVDPITTQPAAFTASTTYIVDSLFGRLPGQAEALLADPTIGPFVRIVSLRVTGLDPSGATALVAQDSVSNMLVARRLPLAAFLKAHGVSADVAYAVSASESHTRASAWYTSDDDGRAGVAFMLDGATLSHRFWCTVPGTIAIHTSSNSLTALHEFQHAASSYTNGEVADLYVDSSPALNCKSGRPIPALFSSYAGTAIASDPLRDGIGYPAGWQSYHAALHDPGRPAVMDNYYMTASPERCQNDVITRMFLQDRLRAKISR
ncbi:MAG: hypothetical protein U0Q55_21250 [Vicinamibacterales bacterium]